jgi:hypothetical protein
VRGPNRLMALAAAIFIFLGGCAVILVVSAVTNEWRLAKSWDESQAWPDDDAFAEFFDDDSVSESESDAAALEERAGAARR